MNQHESFVFVLKKKDLQELVLIRFRTDSPETFFFRSTRSSRSVASLTLPQWGIKELLMVVEAASLTRYFWDMGVECMWLLPRRTAISEAARVQAPFPRQFSPDVLCRSSCTHLCSSYHLNPTTSDNIRQHFSITLP